MLIARCVFIKDTTAGVQKQAGKSLFSDNSNPIRHGSVACNLTCQVVAARGSQTVNTIVQQMNLPSTALITAVTSLIKQAIKYGLPKGEWHRNN